jgi:hypothetical protein
MMFVLITLGKIKGFSKLGRNSESAAKPGE